MGPSGSGQMTKLVNQVAVAVNLEATVEALLLAVRGGLDPALAPGSDWRGSRCVVAAEQSRSQDHRR